MEIKTGAHVHGHHTLVAGSGDAGLCGLAACCGLPEASAGGAQRGDIDGQMRDVARVMILRGIDTVRRHHAGRP